MISSEDLNAWITTIVERPHDRCIFADYLDDNGFQLAAMGERWLMGKRPHNLGWLPWAVYSDHDKISEVPSWLSKLHIPNWLIERSYSICLLNTMTVFEAEKAILWLFEQMEFENGQPVQFASNRNQCDRLFDARHRVE